VRLVGEEGEALEVDEVVVQRVDQAVGRPFSHQDWETQMRKREKGGESTDSIRLTHRREGRGGREKERKG
jgi:hypothetical protein